MKKTIFVLFAILLFFVPLALWPVTSEVFEFNKMVLVYILTALIVGAWSVRMIIERKFIFRPTTLDTPLLIFIGSQFISTILSIDPLTSWLGYYSRFNGGLLSTICYSLLYWAWVTNFDSKETLQLLKIWLAGAALVSLYGVLEHFGIDKNVWVQDVQSRIFSTLGQPNWLAAWLAALIPITWALAIKEKLYGRNFWIYFSLSTLFFWTLIFTKSRSGILGFFIALVIFWIGATWKNWKNISTYLKPFTFFASSLLIIILISGTQFSPSVWQLLNKRQAVPAEALAKGPALEVGGTESGTIRKIVWTGALQIWLHYPIFGTGVETFAYSYYKFRPAEHNLVSEWDFIYNKAHNEFLNVAANSGTVGLVSYLVLIGFTIYIFIQKIENPLAIALLAGYSGLLATNFFGFSVVPTQLQFFLFPAIAIGIAVQSTKYEVQSRKIVTTQKLLIFLVVCTVSYVLFSIGKYWFADTLYAKGKSYNSISRPDVATKYLTQAINLEPNQAIFHSELANSYKSLALSFYQQKDKGNTKKFTDLTISESNTAISLSPANVNLKRSLFGVYITLATTNPNFLLSAKNTLVDAISSAPTDAKLYYNLGLVYARTGQEESALAALKKTIELKANYKEARLAYAILLIDKKQTSEAKLQLEYILKNIDPNDSLTKQTLESIR
ncbi:MAG TPA: O-antigen ligase family protein [Patescibacteria group bacterium]|nr:O-antigen ligase family protein [Patescibacteria group bacterium]